MRTVRIVRPDDLDAFRRAARGLIAAGAAPETVSWQEGEESALPFGDPVSGRRRGTGAERAEAIP